MGFIEFELFAHVGSDCCDLGDVIMRSSILTFKLEILIFILAPLCLLSLRSCTNIELWGYGRGGELTNRFRDHFRAAHYYFEVHCPRASINCQDCQANLLWPDITARPSRAVYFSVRSQKSRMYDVLRLLLPGEVDTFGNGDVSYWCTSCDNCSR